jgi:tRNA isopentenyl-2-thiomethyl-A-37 hydroxylase MiaE
MDKEILEELKNLKLRSESPRGFIEKLFQSRDVIHLAHLKTKSYAAHKALNKYYDSIVDLIDSFVESYQGLYGLIELQIPMSKAEEPISYLESLHKYVDENKKIFTDSALLNQLDEVKSLIQSTLYKLKYLG